MSEIKLYREIPTPKDLRQTAPGFTVNPSSAQKVKRAAVRLRNLFNRMEVLDVRESLQLTSPEDAEAKRSMCKESAQRYIGVLMAEGINPIPNSKEEWLNFFKIAGVIE